DFVAELNVLTIVSNTPHPLDPSLRWHTGPLEVSVLESSGSGRESDRDACRNRSEEARRAFENTDRYSALMPRSA
ncbi:MAG TPA: hypothetical protein VLL25_04790, partial [Acidimicrobiales bacterium]|nr:hypothetical protein [Acidimicrobiales bacterium]